MAEGDIATIYISSLSVFITIKCIYIYTNNITITACFIAELKQPKMSQM